MFWFVDDLVGRRAFGIPYNSLLSHRGLFHSPFFLILFSGVLAGIIARGLGPAIRLKSAVS
jgi:hypothetical protein